MAAQLALKAGKTFWNEHKDISRIHNENLELFFMVVALSTHIDIF